MVTVPDLGIDLEWAFAGADGAGVGVSIVDSGVDPSHPDVGRLTSAVALAWDATAGRVVVDASGAGDLYGHGTACAGIVRRIAPACELHSVRVLGSQLKGKGEVLAHGIRHALDSGARVINLSLSTSRTELVVPFTELADRAAFTGAVLVCAVSNLPGLSYPSQLSSVLSVAANDGTGMFDLDCNGTPPVEFGAPGIDVSVPWLNSGIAVTTGNSFAAPHVAGLVALLLSKHPELRPYEVKAVLRAVSRNAVRAAERPDSSPRPAAPPPRPR